MRSSWTTALISKTAPIIHMCLKKVFPNHLIAGPLWSIALIKACLQDSQFFANSLPSCTFVPILSMSCDYRHAGLSLPLPPEPCPPSLFYPSRCDIEHGQSASVSDSWCCLWVNFLLCADLLECQKVHIFFLIYSILTIVLQHLSSKAALFFYTGCEMVHVSHLYAAMGNMDVLQMVTLICLLVLCYRLLMVL